MKGGSVTTILDVSGAASVVAGIGIMAGPGPALVVAGVAMLAASFSLAGGKR